MLTRQLAAEHDGPMFRAIASGRSTPMNLHALRPEALPSIELFQGVPRPSPSRPAARSSTSWCWPMDRAAPTASSTPAGALGFHGCRGQDRRDSREHCPPLQPPRQAMDLFAIAKSPDSDVVLSLATGMITALPSWK